MSVEDVCLSNGRCRPHWHAYTPHIFLVYQCNTIFFRDTFPCEEQTLLLCRTDSIHPPTHPFISSVPYTASSPLLSVLPPLSLSPPLPCTHESSKKNPTSQPRTAQPESIQRSPPQPPLEKLRILIRLLALFFSGWVHSNLARLLPTDRDLAAYRVVESSCGRVGLVGWMV